MKYLLLVCVDEPIGPGTPGVETLGPDTEAWVEEMDGRGARLIGDRVVEPRDATTVRVRDGEVLLTDGPYAETKEHDGRLRRHRVRRPRRGDRDRGEAPDRASSG